MYLRFVVADINEDSDCMLGELCGIFATKAGSIWTKKNNTIRFGNGSTRIWKGQHDSTLPEPPFVAQRSGRSRGSGTVRGSTLPGFVGWWQFWRTTVLQCKC